MSGGQQQRVALARALVNRPTVLLLDEPLGALDLKLRKEMQLELKALQREVGITFVYVTHDQEEALTMSDVIVVMRDGLIQQMGGPTELYERPVNRFVADFIGTSNFMPGTVDRSTPRPGRVDRPERTRIGPARHGSPIRQRQLGAGQAVTVATRPERLEVAAVGTTGDGRRLGVRLGTHPSRHLPRRPDRVPGAKRSRPASSSSVARTQRERGASQGLGPGDPVIVRWREEANLVLVG